MDLLRQRSYLYILLSVALWSTAEVVTRLVVGYITPVQLSFVRFAVGGAFLAVFLPFELYRKKLWPTRQILFHSAWIALIGIVVTNLAYQYSLTYAGAGVVATVFGSSPLFTLIISALLLGDPLTRPRLLGVLTGLGGIGVMTLSRESQYFTLTGLGFALVCSVSLSVFTVLVKKFGGKFGGLPITTFCILFGAIYLLPLVFVEGRSETLQNISIIWKPVLYLAIATTGVSYLLFFKGLEHIDSTQAISGLFLKPPMATLLAYVWLKEPITWNLVVALLLILAGLYLVTKPNRLVKRLEALESQLEP